MDIIDQPTTFGLQMGDTIDLFRRDIESGSDRSNKDSDKEQTKWIREKYSDIGECYFSSEEMLK